MPTLTLTSPLTRSEHVRRAQLALAGENILRTDFLRGQVDGVFGEATGRACRRAKYWLGYPEHELLPVYGTKLDQLLTGKRHVPGTYLRRRRARLENAGKQTLGEKALAHLAPLVGMKENPAGSNRCPISDWYGVRGPWCAMTVTKGMVAAGSKAFKRAELYAYVPFMLSDARAGRNGLQVITRAQLRLGDIGCADWQRGNGSNPYTFDHCLFFRGWKDQQHGQFLTREGNTSFDEHGSQSNGGALADRTRDFGDATFAWIRVGR